MPIAPDDLRILPDVGASIFTAPLPPEVLLSTFGQFGTNISSTGTFATWLLAAWFNFGPTPSDAEVLFEGALGSNAAAFNIGTIPSMFGGGTQISVNATDAGNNPILFLNQRLVADTGDENWHSLAISFAASTQTIQVLLDLSLLTITGATWSSTNPCQSSTGVAVNGYGFNGSIFEGQVGLYDFRWGVNEGFFDLSNPTNVAKLFGAGNVPISWGTDGSEVTGAQPLVFLHGAYPIYMNNLGYGGGPLTASGFPNPATLGPWPYAPIP